MELTKNKTNVVFTERGDKTRIISLRLASKKERSRYVAESP